MAFLSGYTTRRKITIDKSKIDDDLTDFPVLVKLTSSNFDFSKANSDGYDMRFTSSDGTTLLKYERERHDATNKLAEYWVKIPSVSSSADTDFYLYFRSLDTDDGADPTNVWDSNFKGVWHMKDLTTSTIEDSTSNNNDGAKKASNEPIQADGQIAKAQSFDGSNDYIGVSSPTGIPSGNSPYTIEAWIKPDAYGNKGIVGWGNWETTNQCNAFRLTDDGLVNYWWDNDLSVTVSGLTDGGYHYVLALFDGTTRAIYVDNVSKGSDTPTGHNAVVSNFRIGSTYNGGYFDGIQDEVRISSVARSSAWIKASYYSGNNSLVSYGNEEGIDNAVFFGCNF